MKIATWNVNSLKVRLPQVIHWLNTHQPDILALQELKLDQDQFPFDEIKSTGYQAVWYGQKTYNGVALLAREDLHDVDCGLVGDQQRRMIAATVGNVRVVNVYCVNGQDPASDKFQYKKQWFKSLKNYLEPTLKAYPKTIVLGDFNIAPRDLDVYNPQKWQGKILCTPDERSWFQALLDLGLTDSLRTLDSTGSLFTWWDYRMNGFARDWGLRIDHILISQSLRAQSFGIDRNARGVERASDHAPVWIEVV